MSNKLAPVQGNPQKMTKSKILKNRNKIKNLNLKNLANKISAYGPQEAVCVIS